MKMKLKSASFTRFIRYPVWKLDSLRYAGNRFYCPMCGGNFNRMKPFVGSFSLRGVETDHYTANAICPRCHSEIRQRFVAEFIRLNTDLLKRRQRVIHFAPEIGLFKLLEAADIDYVPADINPSQFIDAIYADITEIPFQEEFDHVICIHVLEHIEDDRKALREIYRVLKPGGRALLAIPIYGDTTYEDPTLDFSGREKQYGKGDHLRLNGLDFAEKLKSVGFQVELFSFDDIPGEYLDRSVKSPHIESDEYLFYCTK